MKIYKGYAEPACLKKALLDFKYLSWLLRRAPKSFNSCITDARKLVWFSQPRSFPGSILRNFIFRHKLGLFSVGHFKLSIALQSSMICMSLTTFKKAKISPFLSIFLNLLKWDFVRIHRKRCSIEEKERAPLRTDR